MAFGRIVKYGRFGELELGAERVHSEPKSRGRGTGMGRRICRADPKAWSDTKDERIQLSGKEVIEQDSVDVGWDSRGLK